MTASSSCRLCLGIVRRFLPPLLLLFCAVFARGEFLPTLQIIDIQVSDVAIYTGLVARANEFMRANHQVPLYLRAYESIPIQRETPVYFALHPGASAEAVTNNRQLFAEDSKLGELRAQLDRVASAGPIVLLKAVRFDGTHTPGWLINTLVNTNDEPSLLARVTELSDRLTLPDQPKPKINVFRVTAGTSEYTHLISINSDSARLLKERCDTLAFGGWSLAFASSSGVHCEIVRSTQYHELLSGAD